MQNEWEALFGADIDDEEEEKALPAVPEKPARKKPVKEETEDEEDVDEDIDDDPDEEEDEPKPKKKLLKNKKEKKEKPKKEKTVHGLKRKEHKEVDPYAGTGKGHGVYIAIGLGAIAVIAAIGVGGFVANRQVQAVTETNENLTAQIASRTKNVYTAKRDLKAGDAIVTDGSTANVELSQVYTSLDDDAYISAETSGYAQVDIDAGMPVMANDVADTNPDDVMTEAIDEATSKYTKAKTMPYRITADFVDLETGNALAESRDLLLDDGANEKAFNTEAESIDGYVLTSIQVDGKGVHAYGVSEKSMKEGIVTMHYYTTKAGWGRHEIKGNIRVTYGYKKANEVEDEETDILDDSAWFETETDSAAEETVEETSADETVIDAENAEADAASTEEAASE